MITTPIADFILNYQKQASVRFHMPGHKGKGLPENAFDITEIDGAGNLFAEEGIIAESERNASDLFGCRTFYSTEGASLAIRTMLALVTSEGNRTVLAARNAHRSYLSAAILLDLDTVWLYEDEAAGCLTCRIKPEQIERALFESEKKQKLPAAVYLTSPDYLGNIADVRPIAEVCRRFHVPLLVDNAHGAYLKWLERSLHPIDLGADMCVDSAHKTLPVLTGGAYLHLSDRLARKYEPIVKETMALFSSSSPSYLILRSLDLANPVLAGFSESLSAFLPIVSALKKRLSEHGYELGGNEPLKLTVLSKPYGYTGCALADILEKQNLYPEFYDQDQLTCMFTPQNTAEELQALSEVLCGLPRKERIRILPPRLIPPEYVLSPREAFLSPRESIPLDQAKGRICAAVSVSCPPAIPIAVSGERLDLDTIGFMRYYGIDTVSVVRGSAESC